jgi:hypothetical protein
MLSELRAFQQSNLDDVAMMARKQEKVDVLEVAKNLSLGVELLLDNSFTYEYGLLDESSESLVLMCHRPLLQIVLLHLLENSARVLRRTGAPARGLIRLKCARSRDGSGGIIQVEDSAGATEELEAGVRAVQGKLSTIGLSADHSGLYQALRFFRYYSSTIKVSQLGGFTILKIHLNQDFPVTL